MTLLRTIRSRYIAAFLALSVGPILLLGFLVAEESYRNQYEQALQRQQELTDHLALKVTGYFERLEENLQLLDFYQPLMSLPLAQQQRLVSTQLIKSRLFSEMVLLDAAGSVVLHQSLTRAITDDSQAAWARHEAFIQSSRQRQLYTGPVSFNAATGEPEIVLGLPLIERREQRLSGVLVARAQLKRVWELVGAQLLSPGGDIYMVSEFGRVVAHRNPSVVLRGTQMPRSAIVGRRLGLHGDEVIAAQRSVSFGQQTFHLIAEHRVDEAMAPARRSVQLVVLVTLFALLFALLLIANTIRRIIQPLESLSRTVSGIRDGDLAQRSAIESDDEIGLLAGTINEMSASLAATVQSLEESRERMQLLLDSTGEGLYGVDTEGRCTFINPACLQLLGYDSADEVVGENIHRLIHHSHEDGSPYLDADCPVSRSSREGKPIHVEAETFWRRDGSAFIAEYKAYPIRRRGEVIGSVASLKDITEWRKVEGRLRQSAVVVENTGDGILITDSEGRIIAVNPAFTAITGYGEAEVMGKSPALLKSGRHGVEFYRDMWSALEQSGEWRGEIWNRRKSGEIYPQWLTITAVSDADGRLRQYIAVFTDITFIKQSQERLEHMAHHDALTGLPNRTLLNLRLEHAIHMARRDRKRISVLFADLDGFKHINDSLGHDIGDMLLEQAAERLRAEVREQDTVARLGGDEFVIIAEQQVAEGDAAVLAQKLLDCLSQPFMVEQYELYLGASIGISIFPSDGNDVDSLIRNADAAMYQAKHRGRNNYQFYTLDLTSSAYERLSLESSLRKGLEQGELSLYYQPKYSLASGELVGAEALLRWHNPELGFVPPDKFIPIAEDSGLILAIGEWVLRQACEQLVAWDRQGRQLRSVAVNVSGVQVQRGKFEQLVQQVLAESGLAAERLELEVTESFIMSQAEECIGTLQSLREMGVQLAIDDFGTGYSSLSYLKRLPIDKIKIDRSFVRDVIEDRNDAAIVRAITAMADTLNLHVVAEGIETVEQRDFLSALTCHEGQGYLYSKPLPAAEFAALLEPEG